MATSLLQDLQTYSSRSTRDGGYGGGGGGCGGFEVFAFLAFLLALLDLIMDLNNMDAGGDGGMRALQKREVWDTSSEGLEQCKPTLDVHEAIWAVEVLLAGVLEAVSNAPPCDRYHLCHAARKAAVRGPLPSTLTFLASEWLDSWPDFENTNFGSVIRFGLKSSNCTSYYTGYNCSVSLPITQQFPLPPLSDENPVHKELQIRIFEKLQNYIDFRRPYMNDKN